MSGKSPIQWTEATWNPVAGCKRVSAGCDHCYAFDLHDKRHIAWKRGRWPEAPVQYHKPFSQVQLLPERLSDPLHWRRPRRVFVNSMSDLFHEAVPDAFISSMFTVMAQSTQHTFQILTKRPERMRALMRRWYGPMGNPFGPLPNVWLGVSVENQQAADERIPLLLQTPAAVRFISAEPLLGRVDLEPYLVRYDRNGEPIARRNELHWVIIGGESGTNARWLDLDWPRSIIEQCQAAQVPIFMKQLGSVWASDDEWCRQHRDRHGGLMEAWPHDLRIREFPRAARGGGA